MKKFYALIILLIAGFALSAQTLDSISPNTGYAGQQSLNTNISATNLFQVIMSPNGNIYDIQLRQGANVIPIYDFPSQPWSYNLNVIDPNNASAIFSIPSNAALGSYDLELTTTDPFNPGSNLQPYSVGNAFTVVPPDGYISGKVYYDLNENGVFDVGETPFVNRTVLLQPGNQNAITDANGDYIFGVPNGNYTISPYLNTNPSYLLTTDTATLSIIINSANVSGVDIGLVHGLSSVSPSVVFQGQTINSNVTSRSLFQFGPNAWGNISNGNIRRTTSPTNQYNISSSSFNVIDSNNAQLVFQIPVIATPGVYDLTMYVGGFYYKLSNAFTVIAAPSYLEGISYYDANSNSMYDIGEPPIATARFALDPDSSYAFSDAYGNFKFGASLGTHTLSYNSGVPNFTLTTQASYTFTNTGNQSGFDFGFRSALPDYSTSLSFNPGFMRCFRTVVSQIVYSNTSNVVSQGTVYLIKSPNTTLVSSVPPFTSQNADTTFWTFSNLQPMETRRITLDITNPGSGVVSFVSGINVEDGSGIQQYHADKNYSTSVSCSYDPNDKAAIPEGVDDVMHYTLNTDPIEYLIRFQNTGNDTAFTVVIRDTIDAAFDLTTLEIIASSHPVQTQVDSNRAAVFTFDNILLADSVVDEPNSHGYVRYRIHPNAILVDPTVVENTAYIYFDFNPAVVTNTTWNTLVAFIPVGISESIQVDDGVFFYPNPMNQRGYFTFANPHSDKIQLELFDVKGQKADLLETYTDYIELNRKGLSSGLYYFRMINLENGKVNSGKISIK